MESDDRNKENIKIRGRRIKWGRLYIIQFYLIIVGFKTCKGKGIEHFKSWSINAEKIYL